MRGSELLAWLTHDPTTVVTGLYWLATSLTVITAVALVVVAIFEFRRVLARTCAGPLRPGMSAGVGRDIFRASARDAFHSSSSRASGQTATSYVAAPTGRASAQPRVFSL